MSREDVSEEAGGEEAGGEVAGGEEAGGEVAGGEEAAGEVAGGEEARSADGAREAAEDPSRRREAHRRWRLALGRYSETPLQGLGGGGLSGRDAKMDAALDYLYGREYEARGMRQPGQPKPPWSRRGGLGPTQMSAINWLGRARALFPESVFETLQDHALDRYGLTELLNDPATLDQLAPSPELLKTLLAFDGRADPRVKEKLRAVANQIIREIMEKLKPKVERAFGGRRNRFRRSNIPSAANFDWRATIRDNLKSYDPERRRLIAERLRFMSRERRRLPWRIILCVDQSGSMTDSIIYSAVMAAILCGLPGVRVNMVLFDTSILDVSDRLSDPLETLLSVQLGGGTDIGSAVSYCEQLVEDPRRTVLVLITDFFEGASPGALFAATARLHEAQVRMIGLGALDGSGAAAIDDDVAGRLATLGMQIAAMTPDRLADWLAEVMA